MNFDYQFGNEGFKYFGDTGVKFTKYSILAPE